MECEDKLAFDNKDKAEKAALVAKYQHGAKVKAYLCKNCGLWHLSSDYETS